MSDGPYRASRFWNETVLVTGNPIVWAASDNDLFYGDFFQFPSADGDTLDITLNVAPGNYELRMFGQHNPASPMQDVFFNGVLVGTVDRSVQQNFDSPSTDVFNVTVTDPINVVRSVVNGLGINSVAPFYNVQIVRVSLVRV